jgi:thiol:disulfide interchange protein DsbD
MNQRTVSGIKYLMAIALLCASAGAALEFYQKTNTVEWVPFADAAQYAKEKNKLIYIDFYADWCQPCKQMDKSTFTNDSVITLLKNEFIATRINVDEPLFGQPMMKKYNISAMPTALLLGSDQQEVRRYVGFMNAEEFIVWLKKKK